MEQLLNTGIKEIILKFPETAGILNRYHIGCAPCNVGTCLLKDIVNIHDLSPIEEKELFQSLGNIFFPGEEVKIPEFEKKEKSKARQGSYSPPLKMLADEHVQIKKLIALIPAIAKPLDLKNTGDIKVVTDCVDFIRNYADRFHHAKEEDILFKYFDENLDILKVMHEDHAAGRNHVRAILEALDKSDSESAAEHLLKYAELLTEHIKKEDEVLYPWMDRNLTTREIGELYSKFYESDRGFMDSQSKYEELINALESKYKFKGE